MKNVFVVAPDEEYLIHIMLSLNSIISQKSISNHLRSPELGHCCNLPHLSCYSSKEHTLLLLMVLISKGNVSSNSAISA